MSYVVITVKKKNLSDSNINEKLILLLRACLTFLVVVVLFGDKTCRTLSNILACLHGLILVQNTLKCAF